MARIRMLTSVAGADGVWHAGEERDLPGDQATEWADGVRAVLVRAEPVETPESLAPERTARKRSSRRETRTA
ncbi:hypothetical protein PUR59_01415 [Streptomyces sp. SP18ES09]|uniref:hypothetical protein n=1 Tax=Streptomyces sp. SP18ES09 TaxID=3002532 RepID=UPI002E7A190E|nr:hypothetical protein [Streptomyces sp. SP18ES09]MEE1813699.1 hypothetical protein [Streptomyces sp. SP18ES09]